MSLRALYADLRDVADRLSQQLDRIERNQETVMATLEDLQTAETAETEAVQASLAQLNNLSDQLAAAHQAEADPVAIQALVDQIHVNTAKLAAALRPPRPPPPCRPTTAWPPAAPPPAPARPPPRPPTPAAPASGPCPGPRGPGHSRQHRISGSSVMTSIEETCGVIENAAREIRQLRHRNEVLEAKVETMELFAQVLHTQPAYKPSGAGIDAAWQLDELARELIKPARPLDQVGQTTGQTSQNQRN